jgi:hypothetical protein
MTENYKRISDDDLLAEWERGEPLAIVAREPVISRSIMLREGGRQEASSG